VVAVRRHSGHRSISTSTPGSNSKTASHLAHMIGTKSRSVCCSHFAHGVLHVRVGLRVSASSNSLASRGPL
jgi:hypothetical protein